MSTAIRITASLSWLGITFLVFVLWRVARFYERSAARRVYSYLFVPPLFCLPAGAAYYIIFDVDFVGSGPADMLFLVGGGFLFVATFLLRQAMVGER